MSSLGPINRTGWIPLLHSLHITKNKDKRCLILDEIMSLGVINSYLQGHWSTNLGLPIKLHNSQQLLMKEIPCCTEDTTTSTSTSILKDTPGPAM